MLSEELLAILVCPACHTKLSLIKQTWLVCPNPDCARKYPIVQDIPNLLIEEGTKHIHVAVQDLPDPNAR